MPELIIRENKCYICDVPQLSNKTLTNMSSIFFQDIFIESGIVSEGSIKGVLSGKHYNRSIFCHKTVYETLERLRFETFLDTLDEESQERIHLLTMDLRDSFKQGKFREYVESQPFNELFLEYEKFVAESSGKSKTFAYWSMYLKMAGKKCFLIVIL
jgi:hypothetical protein